MDHALLQQQQLHQDTFPLITINDIDLIGFLHQPTDTWRIAVPYTLLDPIIIWFHHILEQHGSIIPFLLIYIIQCFKAKLSVLYSHAIFVKQLNTLAQDMAIYPLVMPYLLHGWK